ncbi:pseudaminic acid synthase [Balneolaceae bacterium YR4-1]|uniref:Pseudaminic acid synthase n=1 Tax=Halalkalibaculum roseum TaxID=2709311 RepID=A0A6M1SSY6_9BACT|nr:pseudaminic acid synthase [Halalkalibaculum roseum]NGP78149.1 pseudaminic acid synthase [Halalkalibaculum roseum]
MKIGHFEISVDSKTFIIAELSANHNGDKEIALKTIKAAKEAGADAIKLQTYTPDTITIDCDNKYFQIEGGTLWDGKTLYDLYAEAYTPWEWHEELFNAARREGLIVFSSPFDKTAVDFLEELDTPAYKIASFEIQDIPLIEYAASKGKPIIMSTGIATEEDIQLAVDTCRKAGNEEIILLKCTSSYPAPVELANLRTMVEMKKRFGVEVGLSDHTLGNTVPIVATSLGATVIEKHFILDKSIGGPDADFSLDLEEFSSMVIAVREAEKALGEVTYELSDKVEKNKKFARSLFAVKDIKKGEIFTDKNVKSIRPGYGLHPKYLDKILNRQSKASIQKGTPISKDVIKDII